MSNPLELQQSLKRYLSTIFKKKLPDDMSSMSVTIAYFALSGLDLLGAVCEEEARQVNQKFIHWIYCYQCPNKNVSGFENCNTFNVIPDYRIPHVAATYCALNCLVILGDDLSRVNKKSILSSLRQLQLEDGSFRTALPDSESDMRSVFCAAAICYILDDWSGMDIKRTIDYVLKSISYDGGIAQGPDLESHAGSTYCAVATLSLLDSLSSLTELQTRNLIRWLVNLQEHGFKGRCNKLEDTCYTFWVGATLKILDCHQLVDAVKLTSFVRHAQDRVYGGFKKSIGFESDPLHTYLSLAGLSLMRHDDLELIEVEAPINISKRAFAHLKKLHKMWRSEASTEIND